MFPDPVCVRDFITASVIIYGIKGKTELGGEDTGRQRRWREGL